MFAIEFSDRLQVLAHQYYYIVGIFKVFCIVSKKILNYFAILANNNNIIVCRPAKGRSVEIHDRRQKCGGRSVEIQIHYLQKSRQNPCRPH